MNKPLTVQVPLTVRDITDIVTALKARRSESDYTVERDDLLDDDGRYVSWRVSYAEEAMPKRVRLSELIYQLSGELLEDSPETNARVREAVAGLAAQKAADKAAEEAAAE